MKAECTKEKFNFAVSKADKVTGRNMTLPILSCILIEAKDNSLVLRSTNLDLGLEVRIPAKVTKQGLVAVPGSIMAGFLSNLSDEGSVKLEEREGNLYIESSVNRAVIKCHPVDDFPTIPQIKDGKEFEINSTDFVDGLKSVIYSASLSTVKPELSSVYIHTEGDSLFFVATDSFRLAEKKIKVKKIEDFGQVLIPFKNVADILKIISDEKDSITLNSTKNQVCLKYKDVYLVSRVIDGLFPDYKQIIPKENKTEVVVLKKDMFNALKLSNIFADSFNQINIKISPNEKKVEFKTKNSSVGENINRLSATIEGEPVEINFNHKYIVDCFQSINSDSLILSFNGMNKPLVIKGSGDKTFTYLVMPMNR